MVQEHYDAGAPGLKRSMLKGHCDKGYCNWGGGTMMKKDHGEAPLWRSTVVEHRGGGSLWWRSTVVEEHHGGGAQWCRSTMVEERCHRE